MIVKQEWEFCNDKKISDNEFEVIEKFLDFYRNQDVIVADTYRTDYSIVPLEDEEIIFKKSEDWKSFDICKTIYYKGKPYVVELGIWRPDCSDDDRKCLRIREFRIITNGKVHFINLNTNNASTNIWLSNIINIFFDEKRVISPEEAYCKRMYTNKPLQNFIENHEWNNIAKGIKQDPSLANALFVINESYVSPANFTAFFGTILYQLISFRQNNIDDFDKKDLLSMDKLIYSLRETELLKVELHEKTSNSISYPTNSVLLDGYCSRGKLHLSQQFTVSNTGLSDENKVLRKCIRDFKK